MREMKYSGVEWIGEIPQAWSLIPTKRRFGAVKRVAGEQVNEYERLALTMNGVIKRSKDDIKRFDIVITKFTEAGLVEIDRVNMFSLKTVQQRAKYYDFI